MAMAIVAKIETYEGDALRTMLYGYKRAKGRYFGSINGGPDFRGQQRVMWRGKEWRVYDAEEGKDFLLCLKRNIQLARHVNPDEVTPI